MDMEVGTWFAQDPCQEMMIFSEYYDFSISLLQLGRKSKPLLDVEINEDEESEDLGTLIRRNHGIE